MRRVPVSILTLDSDLQCRAQMSEPAVQEYAQAYRDGITLPPPIVFFDTKTMFVADGFHRVEAAKIAGIEELECDVRSGVRRDALMFALGANAQHGVPRTIADKRLAVEKMLDDPKWGGLSDRVIAGRCRVSHTFVQKMRKSRREGVQGGNVATLQQSDQTQQRVPDEPVSNVSEVEVQDAPRLDKAGKLPIQHEQVRQAFDQADEIERAVAVAKELVGLIDGLQFNPSASYLNHTRTMADASGVHTALKTSLPYAVCPTCGGTGCSQCKSRGWMNKMTYEVFSPDGGA
ncbi:MAG: ParB N-terminal domain-containing protein [Planctomycetota bacterium]